MEGSWAVDAEVQARRMASTKGEGLVIFMTQTKTKVLSVTSEIYRMMIFLLDQDDGKLRNFPCVRRFIRR